MVAQTTRRSRPVKSSLVKTKKHFQPFYPSPLSSAFVSVDVIPPRPLLSVMSSSWFLYFHFERLSPCSAVRLWDGKVFLSRSSCSTCHGSGLRQIEFPLKSKLIVKNEASQDDRRHRISCSHVPLTTQDLIALRSSPSAASASDSRSFGK